MSPSPKFAPRRSIFLSTSAFFRRFVTLLLASVLLLLLAGSALASIGAPRPLLAQTFTPIDLDPGELPDVALLISGVETADPAVERMVMPSLRDLPGVEAVVAEMAPSGRIALHISLDPSAGPEVVAAVRSVVATTLPDANVAIGGRVVADQDLLNRLNRGTVIAVVPVVVLLTVLVAVAFGGRFGAAAGGTVGLSTLLGGLVGAQVAGRFDGTMATTAVPAVLVAILVSTVLTLRLLEWFKNPIGADQAEAIGNSVRHLLPETGLLFGGLIATALILEVVGPGRATASVVAAGGVVAAIITLGALPALLSTFERVPTKDDGIFSSEVPDGRDFPIAVLGGFALFLLGLGLLAIRVPTGELLDESALAPGVSSRRVSEQLIELGGDPTSAILAELPATVPEDVLSEWAVSVSELGTVGWVQTSVGRFAGGERVGPSDSAVFVDDDAIIAIVTPMVTARSEAAEVLVDTLAASGGTAFDVALSGAPVDAAAIVTSATSQLWILVVLLSVSGGLAILVLVGDLAMAAATVAMRFLGLAAALGVYRIVAGDVGGSELQVAALVLGVGVGLFEIGFVRRITAGLRSVLSDSMSAEQRSELVTSALHREGRAAMFGLGITALCGLGFIVGDLAVTRRLGVAVAAAVIVEMLIGTWLLRPVVLGQRLVGDGSPIRSSIGARMPGIVPSPIDLLLELGQEPELHRGQVDSEPEEQGSTIGGLGKRGSGSRTQWREMLPIGRPLSATFADEVVVPQWRRIVSGLLRSEFAFQSNPGEAELETVFVTDTPLFAELENHNHRLRAAGLSIAGDGPVLHKVTAVNQESPVTLAITVDHPERRLYNAAGQLVGTRRPERRHGMLWLVQDPSGRYRIAEAVDLGSEPSEQILDLADTSDAGTPSGMVPVVS